jgi:cellulose synthase/poly-beta-1,6-N-acetylglucosamine synthase-like glycosyltransferase
MDLEYSVSAVVPAYNAQATLCEVLEAIQKQRIELEELLVIDDASTDETVECAYSLGALVEVLEENKGRGFVRAKAMEEASGDLVLSCDATAKIGSGFLKNALKYFKDEKVAAVFGSLRNLEAQRPIEHWAKRHLFREDAHDSVNEYASLLSAVAVFRKEAVLSVGSFDKQLREHEDFDLGERLLNAGWKVIYDPSLPAYGLTRCGFWRTLERYSRWNQSQGDKPTFLMYLKQVWFSLKSMAWSDLRSGQWACAAISVFSPHYQYYCYWFKNK